MFLFFFSLGLVVCLRVRVCMFVCVCLSTCLSIFLCVLLCRSSSLPVCVRCLSAGVLISVCVVCLLYLCQLVDYCSVCMVSSVAFSVYCLCFCRYVAFPCFIASVSVVSLSIVGPCSLLQVSVTTCVSAYCLLFGGRLRVFISFLVACMWLLCSAHVCIYLCVLCSAETCSCGWLLFCRFVCLHLFM